MKKNVITIRLDVVTVAYLETLLYCSGKSSLSLVIRDLVKDNFEELIDFDNCCTYMGNISPEFNAFPKTKHYFIRMDEHSMACLDILGGELSQSGIEPLRSRGELGQSHSEVLRWLVIREFTKLQLTLRQSIHQTEIS